jgi:hypothetical protein
MGKMRKAYITVQTRSQLPALNNYVSTENYKKKLTSGLNCNMYTVLVGKPEGNRSFGRPKSRWVDNIEMYTFGSG